MTQHHSIMPGGCYAITVNSISLQSPPKITPPRPPPHPTQIQEKQQPPMPSLEPLSSVKQQNSPNVNFGLSNDDGEKGKSDTVLQELVHTLRRKKKVGDVDDCTAVVDNCLSDKIAEQQECNNKTGVVTFKLGAVMQAIKMNDLKPQNQEGPKHMITHGKPNYLIKKETKNSSTELKTADNNMSTIKAVTFDSELVQTKYDRKISIKTPCDDAMPEKGYDDVTKLQSVKNIIGLMEKNNDHMVTTISKPTAPLLFMPVKIKSKASAVVKTQTTLSGIILGQETKHHKKNIFEEKKQQQQQFDSNFFNEWQHKVHTRNLKGVDSVTTAAVNPNDDLIKSKTYNDFDTEKNLKSQNALNQANPMCHDYFKRTMSLRNGKLPLAAISNTLSSTGNANIPHGKADSVIAYNSSSETLPGKFTSTATETKQLNTLISPMYQTVMVIDINNMIDDFSCNSSTPLSRSRSSTPSSTNSGRNTPSSLKSPGIPPQPGLKVNHGNPNFEPKSVTSFAKDLQIQPNRYPEEIKTIRDLNDNKLMESHPQHRDLFEFMDLKKSNIKFMINNDNTDIAIKLN